MNQLASGEGWRPTEAPFVPVRSRRDLEEEVRSRVAAERARLQDEAGLTAGRPEHFHRPAERPFTAEEREKVTLLFGGLTWKHEWLIKASFESAGYRVEIMPTPDVAAFQLGKEFGNNGQCNPTYFTVGHLIKYLQGLEAQGLSRKDIIDRYVFISAGSCGPCRFGMYEAEYRLAVQNAGFDGFRIVIIQQNQGVNAQAPGLAFSTDFRIATLRAINIGDVLNDVANQIRPYEVEAGQTDRVFTQAMADLSAAWRDRDQFDVMKRAPAWVSSRLEGRDPLRHTIDSLGTIYDHFFGGEVAAALQVTRDSLAAIEVDRLRVKPIVKVTGEFWAQTTEGDGNFHMFRFLEREGAEVIVEPVANWIMYLIWLMKARSVEARGTSLDPPKWWEVRRRLGAEWRFRKRVALIQSVRSVFGWQYRRLIEALGGIAHPLSDMDELARLAHPYYNQFSRGGEGHLEVAKNIYYTLKKKSHMVLSLKPFGCMPSSQSDGVQSAVMSHFKDMIFLPIETSGEGEVNAHSRVQMALGEAKVKAKAEFQQVLASTGRRLDDVRAYVSAHPELRHPFYQVPAREGVTGTAARFVLHVDDLMAGRVRPMSRPQQPRGLASRMGLPHAAA